MNDRVLPRIGKAAWLAALVAAGAGVAHADDSSLSPFIGDSYAAFNGADRPAIANPRFDNAPSAWRREHPDGLSERALQAYSSSAEAWNHNPPTYSAAPAVAAFRETHPNGLTEHELQALSSEASPWQLRAEPQGASVGAPSSTLARASSEPLGERIAGLFHRERGR